jgi:hypothetical protein
METEEPAITFELSDQLRAAEGGEVLGASHRTEPYPDWQGSSFLAVTFGLAVSAFYLAFGSWSALTRALANPASNQVVILALMIQVFSPFLPALSCAAIHLGARRDAPWYLSATVLCSLGILIATLEILAHALG